MHEIAGPKLAKSTHLKAFTCLRLTLGIKLLRTQKTPERFQTHRRLTQFSFMKGALVKLHYREGFVHLA